MNGVVMEWIVLNGKTSFPEMFLFNDKNIMGCCWSEIESFNVSYAEKPMRRLHFPTVGFHFRMDAIMDAIMERN